MSKIMVLQPVSCYYLNLFKTNKYVIKLLPWHNHKMTGYVICNKETRKGILAQHINKNKWQVYKNYYRTYLKKLQANFLTEPSSPQRIFLKFVWKAVSDLRSYRLDFWNLFKSKCRFQTQIRLLWHSVYTSSLAEYCVLLSGWLLVIFVLWMLSFKVQLTYITQIMNVINWCLVQQNKCIQQITKRDPSFTHQKPLNKPKN